MDLEPPSPGGPPPPGEPPGPSPAPPAPTPFVLSSRHDLAPTSEAPSCLGGAQGAILHPRPALGPWRTRRGCWPVAREKALSKGFSLGLLSGLPHVLCLPAVQLSGPPAPWPGLSCRRAACGVERQGAGPGLHVAENHRGPAGWSLAMALARSLLGCHLVLTSLYCGCRPVSGGMGRGVPTGDLSQTRGVQGWQVFRLLVNAPRRFSEEQTAGGQRRGCPVGRVPAPHCSGTSV